ncbi:MAG TPA: glutathione S-transferase N-terminal domain-containing protein [Pseudomonadales bacterium]|nr:glutathione S-transferase N-terminal domain-containing protein [Pseudomonadales bacterium]
MANADIEFFYWPTPNCWKVAIMLEELGVTYTLHPIDITEGHQYGASFTAVSPNNRVPAITDPDPGFGTGPFHVFESGAILIYLAEKFGRLIPDEPRARYQCIEWLFWQMGGLGPMAGQAHHFRIYAREPVEYAIARYSNECRRLYGVMETHLTGSEYMAGEYSIADIACLPWIFRHERQGIALEDFPAVHRWYRRLWDRPSVQAGFAVGAALRDEHSFTSESGRRVLFGEGKSAE